MPITQIEQAASFFTKVRTFLLDHERMLIAVFAVALVWGVSGKIQDVIAAHDKANLTAQQAVLASQVEKNAALAEQVAQQAQQYKALADKVELQNTALEQANVALATALSKQQKADNGMALPELAKRWLELVPGVSGGLTLTNGQLALSDPASHATVNELERVPVLNQQLSNAKSEKANEDQLLTASNQRVDTLNTRVDGLTLQLKDADKVCVEQIKVVKDEARKSKRRWFIVGYISGLATRGAIKVFTGI